VRPLEHDEALGFIEHHRVKSINGLVLVDSVVRVLLRAAGARGKRAAEGAATGAQLGKAKGDVPLPENEAADPANVVRLRAALSATR
jgi:hypothetical protein